MGAAAFFFVVRRPFYVPVGSRRVDGHHNICEGNGFLIDVYRPAVPSSLFVWPKNMVDQVFFVISSYSRRPGRHFIAILSLSDSIFISFQSNRFSIEFKPLSRLSIICVVLYLFWIRIWTHQDGGFDRWISTSFDSRPFLLLLAGFSSCARQILCPWHHLRF